MPKYETIKVGDILYDCYIERQGNTTIRRMATFQVEVVELQPSTRSAMCRWNGNPPRWYSERHLKRLRRSPMRKKGT